METIFDCNDEYIDMKICYNNQDNNLECFYQIFKPNSLNKLYKFVHDILIMMESYTNILLNNRLDIEDNCNCAVICMYDLDQNYTCVSIIFKQEDMSFYIFLDGTLIKLTDREVGKLLFDILSIINEFEMNRINKLIEAKKED